MKIDLRDLVKLVVLTLAILIGLLFVSQIARVVLLFALAIILAMMLTAPVSWLERRRVPRWAGALLVIAVLVGVLALLGLWLVPPLIEQTSALIAKIPDYARSARAWLAEVTARYPSLQEIVTPDERVVRDVVSRAESVLVQAGQFVLTLLGGLAALVVLLVMTVFTLVHPRPLLRGLFGLVPIDQRLPVARALLVTAQQMRVWAWSSSLVGIIDGTIVWVALSLMGVQPALLLAALVFVGEFFPYIGPIAAAVPAIALALAVKPITALWVLLLYLAIHQLEGSILNPLIVSKQMRFHPLSVGFALLALGKLYGVLGAFLAIPALATLKAFYTELVLTRRGLDEKETEECADIVLESHRPGPGIRDAVSEAEGASPE